MPSITCARDTTWAPACIRSATVRPSRAPSMMKSGSAHRLRVIELDAALEPAPRHDGGGRDHQLVLSRGVRCIATSPDSIPTVSAASGQRPSVPVQPQPGQGGAASAVSNSARSWRSAAPSGAASRASAIRSRRRCRPRRETSWREREPPRPSCRRPAPPAPSQARPAAAATAVSASRSAIAPSSRKLSAKINWPPRPDTPAVGEQAFAHRLADGGAAEHDGLGEQEAGGRCEIDVERTDETGAVE